MQEYNETKTLRDLPEMTEEQLDMLNNHLQQTVMQEGMNPADLESRRTIEVLVSNLVTSNLKGTVIFVNLTLCGQWSEWDIIT